MLIAPIYGFWEYAVILLFIILCIFYLSTVIIYF